MPTDAARSRATPAQSTMPEQDSPPRAFGLQTSLSVALVVVLVGAAVTYGRQSQRLDGIEQEVRESRVEMRGMRQELQSLRELLIRRTPQP